MEVIMKSSKLIFLAIILLAVSQNVGGKKFFAGNEYQFLGQNNKNDPPPANKIALMARYVVHNTDWASVGTISVNPKIEGYPFVGLKSMADGPKDNGTGVPYMLMTDMDVSMNDLNHNNKCTLFVTLAQGDYCKNKKYDPQDPRCARIMLTGTVEKLEKGNPEELFAHDSLYSRHPAMNWWPDHHFYIVKLNIVQVGVLDHFGGISYVTPQDYFAAGINDRTHVLMENNAQEVQVIQIIF